MTVQQPVDRPRRVRARSPLPGTGSRHRPNTSSTFPPAGWLFVAVALALIGVLTYYLTLTTRPEISQISPAPNSLLAPGVVEFEVLVSSQRTIEEARFSIDGESVDASLEQMNDGRWRVFHEQVLERGERQILLEVSDSSGRTAEHSWSIEGAGDLISPRIALMSPPSDAILAPGVNGVTLQLTTFADLGDVEVLFNGESVPADIEAIATGTEYTNQDGVPIYDWEVRTTTTLEGGTVRIDVEVDDEHGARASESWTVLVAGSNAGANARFFERTGEYAVEPFLSFWEENNGETIIGPPVGPPLALDNGTMHQYFRFARLELDQEGNVHLGLVGREIFGQPENPPDRPPGSNARLFEATGHYVLGPIREFWEENGGLMTFGYPLSQQFETEFGYAQYFERALIEVVVLGSLEIVELSPLGEQLYENRVVETLPPEPEDES